MTDNKIELLKSVLPDVLSCCPGLVKESSNSLCGPCPVCGGKDRFVYKTNSGKAFCRQCHPTGMDKIDFQGWRYGKDVGQLLKEYCPGHSGNTWQPPTRQQNNSSPKTSNRTIQDEWNGIASLNESRKPTAIYDFLHGRRGIAKMTIKALYDLGQVQVKTHADKTCVAIPFKTLQGEVKAIQYLSTDGKPFPFTEKNGSPANKVFLKGSLPGAECFFMCGADLRSFDGDPQGNTIIICEAVINTITAVEWFPDTCCIALGGSTYTAKVKALRPYIPHVEKVIVCVDNDSASQKMLQSIMEIIE